MEQILGDEYPAFLQSYEQDRYVGLRINTDKITVEEFKACSPFDLVPIPWSKDGFYVDASIRPAKHPYYHAGLYYLQEPSAMAPVNELMPTLGDYVLDMCAAPGGKTLQLANAVGEQGVVVSNDISASRLKAVLKNIELFGLKNVIVTANDSEKFLSRHRGLYDKVLLDAPCSGEGMFRKDPSMANYWSMEAVMACQTIQMGLVDSVFHLLKPEGDLVYSTCTFAQEENEAVIAHALKNNDQWALQPCHYSDFDSGLIAEDPRTHLTKRVYPHKVNGEGHFMAHLVKSPMLTEASNYVCSFKRNSVPMAFRDFIDDVLVDPIEGNFEMFNEKLVMMPSWVPPLEGFRVLRSGWYVGDVEKNRFEPSQAFAMGLRKKQVKKVITFSLEDSDLLRYLKGESLFCEGESGWHLVCLQEYPLGWAKVVNGRLKNKYPASWRML
jgi:NOL1/NOP2/sun family putative RNA methylase